MIRPDPNAAFCRPVLGPQELKPIVELLASIYRQTRHLREAQAQQQPNGPLPMLMLGDIAKMPLRTRLQSVSDAVSGLDYAAWCIGDTLGSIGGCELMHAVFGMFEDSFGEDTTRPSGWLDHRWNGAGGSTGGPVWAS